MIGHTKLLEELQRVVARSPADGTLVFAEAGTRRVSRFAFGTIHQDLLQESLSISIKVINGRRAGVAVTDSLEREALSRCLKAALEIARHTPPAAHLPELPKDHALISTDDHDPKTARTPVSKFPETLKRLGHLCQGVGAKLAGSYAVGEDETAVVNSAGVSCYAASTMAGTKLVTMYKALSGFASSVHRRIEELDMERVLERSLKQCLHRREAVALPTGTYEVILEPEAVAELVMWLGSIAFGAKAFQERTSFLAGRIGDAVMARSISIYDDGMDPAGLRRPFDSEGVPKQRVALIDRGKAAGIVYDTAYGLLYGHPSTGHAPMPGSTEGPTPSNLFMAAGATKRDELIRRCARGVLIPRFHYVNGLMNPREAVMTGLTREGACLIEDGKIKAPIKTMRFTQSLLEAFSHVRGISKERRLIADPTQDEGCAVMPTLHLAKFRFTGRSEDS